MVEIAFVGIDVGQDDGRGLLALEAVGGVEANLALFEDLVVEHVVVSGEAAEREGADFLTAAERCTRELIAGQRRGFLPVRQGPRRRPRQRRAGRRWLQLLPAAPLAAGALARLDHGTAQRRAGASNRLKIHFPGIFTDDTLSLIFAGLSVLDHFSVTTSGNKQSILRHGTQDPENDGLGFVACRADDASLGLRVHSISL